jgi:hypothetical protein
VGRIRYVDPDQGDNFMHIEVTPAANFNDNSYVLVLQDKTSKSVQRQALLEATEAAAFDELPVVGALQPVDTMANPALVNPTAPATMPSTANDAAQSSR